MCERGSEVERGLEGLSPTYGDTFTSPQPTQLIRMSLPCHALQPSKAFKSRNEVLPKLKERKVGKRVRWKFTTLQRNKRGPNIRPQIFLNRSATSQPNNDTSMNTSYGKDILVFPSRTQTWWDGTGDTKMRKPPNGSSGTRKREERRI